MARALPMAFGQTSSPLYCWLRFGRRILLYSLQHHPSAKVCPPTQQELELCTSSIEAKYPILEKAWGAADGLKLHIQSATNYAEQNKYFNGWHHCHYINCVFVFGADGRIRICVVNCPGVWHDSTMADYGVYKKMEALFNM